MATKVAEIFAEISLDATKVPAQMESVKTKVTAVGQQVGQALSGPVAGGANKFNFAMQNVSYGVQDFMQQLGPMGLAGALSASANNWSQVAMIMAPVGGVYAGIAITLASVLVPQLLKLVGAQDKATYATKTMTSALTEQLNAIEQMSSLRQSRFPVEAGSFGDAQKSIDTHRTKLEEAETTAGQMEAARLRKMAEISPIGQHVAIDAANLTARNIDEAFKQLTGRETRGNAAGGMMEHERLARGLDVKTDAGTIKIDRELNLMYVERQVTGKQIADGEKEIASLLGKQGDKAVEILRIKNEIEQLEIAGQQAAAEKLDDLRRELPLRTELARTLAKIEEDRRMAQRSVSESDATGVDAFALRGRINERARREASQAKNAALKDETDRDEQRYAREQQNAHAQAKMFGDLERDNLGDRAGRIYDIKSRLEDRLKGINSLEDASPEEKARLKRMSASAAERQLAMLRPQGGDKLGIPSFGDAVQKALMGNMLEKHAGDTARNTADMKASLLNLITAVNKMNPGATAQNPP